MSEAAETGRERLGRLVAERRRSIGVSLSEAARRAGINRATWTGVEQRATEAEDYTYGKIEQVLQWQPGSIAAILADGDPVALPPRPSANGRPASAEHVDLITQWEEQSIAEILTADIPQSVKDELMAIVRTQAANARIAQDRIRNATAS